MTKARLVSEDLDDCFFYISLCNKMICENGEFCGINISLHSVQCAGSQAYDTVLNELKSGHFCLLIMDSDKDFCNDSIGKSLSNARKIFNHKYNENVIDLHELTVREKENLIPPSYYLLSMNPPQKDLIGYLMELETDNSKSEFLRYLDLKDGIKAKKYKSANMQWHDLYDKNLEEFEKRNLLLYP